MAAVLGAALTALLVGGIAMAQQLPPHTFYGFEGDVTIDGENAPAGTEILASTGDSATIDEDGSWSLEVAGDSENVSFTVAGLAAEGALPAPSGGVTRVILAVSTPPPPADDCPDDTGMDEGSDDLSEGDTMDEGTMSDCPEEDALSEGDTMDEGESAPAGDGGEFPGTGTGGLVGSSSSSAAYAIAGALALVALLGGAGVAIRRRVQS